MRKIVLFVLIIIFSRLFSGQIKVVGKAENYQIFNEKTGKIITYQLLKPGKEISFRTFEVDTLKVFSRILLNGKNEKNYQYLFIVGNVKKTISKKAILSGTSRALSGKKISRYNLVKIPLEKGANKFTFKNLSGDEILLKVSSGKITKSNRKIAFVNFTPSKHGDEKIVQIGDKAFTYFTPKNGEIEFVLEGPIILKTVSRLIFSDNLVKKYKYNFDVFEDNKPISRVNETAYKSAKAVLKNDGGKDISTGNVNIFKLISGIHKIRIENKNMNRDLIFRFYISSAGIEIKGQ